LGEKSVVLILDVAWFDFELFGVFFCGKLKQLTFLLPEKWKPPKLWLKPIPEKWKPLKL